MLERTDPPSFAAVKEELRRLVLVYVFIFTYRLKFLTCLSGRHSVKAALIAFCASAMVLWLSRY